MAKKKFYDTNAVLKLQSKIFENEFVLSSTTLHELEYIKTSKNKNILLLSALIISILFGGLTELLQKYVFIGRYGSVFDLFADAIGCVIGVLLFKILLKKNNKN